MCAEASTVLRAVAADFFGVWKSLRITVFGPYQGASTIMHKAYDWKRSRISVLKRHRHKHITIYVDIPDNRRLRRHMPNDLPTRFLV
jgi:hypothetical protein